MRLRRPAIAATTLGLAGALLPASGAAAEPADRHVVFSEDVTYQTNSGSVGYCTVIARLDWVFGQAGTEDDWLSASTEITGTPGHPSYECAGGIPYDMNAAVTLRWSESQFRRNQTYTYTNEGDVFVYVSDWATPYDDSSHLGTPPESVSSEHNAQITAYDCAANCEWSHTLTFNSK
jgi:hypothetical protein